MRIWTGEVWVRNTVVPGSSARRDVVDEQRVPFATGGMPDRHVQRLEVVPVGLDLWTFGDLEAETDEDVLQALPCLRDEVGVTASRLADELGEVEPFGFDTCDERLGAECLPAGVERGGHCGERLVDRCPGRLLVVDRVERAETGLELGEITLLPGEPGRQGGDLVEVGRSGDVGECRVAGGGDVSEHVDLSWASNEERSGASLQEEPPDERRRRHRSEWRVPGSPGASKSLQLCLHDRRG